MVGRHVGRPNPSFHRGPRPVSLELATTAQLEEISAAWREWAAAEDGWIVIPHGEIICRA